jgi:diacylglycerol kinase
MKEEFKNDVDKRKRAMERFNIQGDVLAQASSRIIDMSYYKSKIIYWVVFWIPSMIMFVLNDLIEKVVDYIYEKTEFIYQYIAKVALKDYKGK